MSSPYPSQPIETHVLPIETHVLPIETHVLPIETHVLPIETISLCGSSLHYWLFMAPALPFINSGNPRALSYLEDPQG